MAFTEDALGHGDVFVAHGDDGFAVVARSVGPGPPVFMIGLAVERSWTRHRDVGFPEGINEGRIVHAFGAFETGKNGRKVVARIAAEEERGVFGEVEIDVAFEVNRTGKEFTRGNHDAAAAGGMAGGDGLTDCGGRYFLSRRRRLQIS